MDRTNSHTKSYNIPRSFEAMYINIKYELRAWVTCGSFVPRWGVEVKAGNFTFGIKVDKIKCQKKLFHFRSTMSTSFLFFFSRKPVSFPGVKGRSVFFCFYCFFCLQNSKKWWLRLWRRATMRNSRR